MSRTRLKKQLLRGSFPLLALCFVGAPSSATPAPDISLNLTAECAVGTTRYWRVTGDDDQNDVDYSWNGPGSNDGVGQVDAGDRQYFTTQDAGGANTTILSWFNPAAGSNATRTKAHNNQPCIYHVTLEKEWTGADAPDLDGATVLEAESSLAIATCTSDDGVLACIYARKAGGSIDDLEVPFGETYDVTESGVSGWSATSGVGTGFTGIVDFDADALPDDLVLEVADDRFCESNPDAEFPFNLESFCTHTVTNTFLVSPTATATATASATATATGTATSTSTPIPDGGSCIDPDDCQSGNCVDDVCCDSACDGEAEACNLPGSVGTCTDVTAAAPATSPTVLGIIVAALLGVGGVTMIRRRRPGS